MKVVTRINELKYDFEKELKQEQLRLEMSSAEFAKHIGMHKSWLLKLWSATEPRHPLSEKTMALINNRVGISYDTMINYNEEVMRDRG
jgi:predicted transcriptional regulator